MQRQFRRLSRRLAIDPRTPEVGHERPNGKAERELESWVPSVRFYPLGRMCVLVDRTRRMNPSHHLSNRLKIIRNLWPCRDGHRVRFVGFHPLVADLPPEQHRISSGTVPAMCSGLTI
jgi:hypothetical protein